MEQKIGKSAVEISIPVTRTDRQTDRLKYTDAFSNDARRASATVRNKRALTTKGRKVCLKEKITKTATVERIWFSRDNPAAVPLYCH
jgi:hypothetical protein